VISPYYRAVLRGCKNRLKLPFYFDDKVQENGTATANQLSLGGKSFLAGSFIDTAGSIPSVAIATTQQAEWEFGLGFVRLKCPGNSFHDVLKIRD